jgi:uncharacterized protein (TIGR02996 family)
MPTRRAKDVRKIATTPTNAGHGLLAQALEAPDDDLPLMVYADWLEGQGHPLAAVIRLQLSGELAEASALVERHRKDWLAPIAAFYEHDPIEFERGLLSKFYTGANLYAQRATQAALLAVASTFGVRASVLRGPCTKLGSCETLAWTTSLHWFDCQLDDDRIAAFAGSPHLARLRSLVLEKARFTHRGLEALAGGDLPRLRHLGLPAPVHGGMGLDVRGFVTLLDRLPLTSLSLSGHRNHHPLMARPEVSRLEQLSIVSWIIPGKPHSTTVRVIASSPHLTALRSLRITSIDRVEDVDVEPFLDNPALRNLTSLRLHLWGEHAPKPSSAMLDRLRARFEGGFVYETQGIPHD